MGMNSKKSAINTVNGDHWKKQFLEKQNILVCFHQHFCSC